MRGIYFSVDEEKEGFQLPHNPEEVNVRIKGDGDGFKIAKLGSVNIPKDIELDEYTLESFFPVKDYYFLVAEAREPSYYIDKIKKWQKEKKPVRYIYVDGSFTVNELVTIGQFDYKEQGGDDDVHFTLSLKKFVPFGPKKLVVKKAVASATSSASKQVQVTKKKTPDRQNTKVQPQTYSLIRGDSLWKVAQKFLGNGNRFSEIAKLNNIKASDYRRLPIGLKVKLPTK